MKSQVFKQSAIAAALLSLLALTACAKNDGETAQAEQTHEQTHEAAGDNHAAGEHGEGHGGHVAGGFAPEGEAEVLGTDFSIYQVGGEWENQHGEMVSLDSFKGKHQIIFMAYTSCQHTCPIIVKSIKKMESEMSEAALANTDIIFVSLDPERDTPTVMQNYIKHNELGEHWHILRSDEASMRMLANTLNIKYMPADNGDINHSNTVSILDTEGRLVAQGNGVADSGIMPLVEYLNVNAK
ncbi:hypothetical protein B0181_03605 [Moraxella caviae]|uniref:BsSco n=1 Tax=Moraxella caviae TaxID=34060 RepID=A0A1T0A691_9GAMM|nr:SCO family protein [Moraxella caviae]OOR91180.1 hypothetical protein B0181_03605 [Moraxella caviae]STZ13783.1 BsSco [Moraxella caviae]VEW13017.1 BsSco [Moraxella caviae]